MLVHAVVIESRQQRLTAVSACCRHVAARRYEFNTDRLVGAVAFTTLSLFNILRFPLVVLPKALRACSEAYSSLSRLEEYLLEDVAVSSNTGITKAAGGGGGSVHIVGRPAGGGVGCVS